MCRGYKENNILVASLLSPVIFLHCSDDKHKTKESTRRGGDGRKREEKEREGAEWGGGGGERGGSGRPLGLCREGML